MKTHPLLFTVVLAVVSLPIVAGAETLTGSILHAPEGALFELTGTGAWSAGVRAEREQRQLRSGDTVRDLRAGRLGVFLAHAPLPWAMLSVGAGTAIADLDGQPKDGEYGMDWNGMLRIGVFEKAITWSPVRGKTQLIRLDAAWDIRRADSNFSDSNFYWQEWRFMPSITYLEAVPQHLGYRLLHPESAALHAGMVFSRVNSKEGGQSLKQNRNFGLRLGTEIRLVDGWIISLDAIAYRASETSVSAGLAHRF